MQTCFFASSNLSKACGFLFRAWIYLSFAFYFFFLLFSLLSVLSFVQNIFPNVNWNGVTVERPVYDEPERPKCIPNPCGPYSQCREIGSTAVCSCLPNYIGRAPNCRPECTQNSECPANRACINERCKDPCPGSCGISAYCSVVNHSPVCACDNGFTGDPFSGCYPVPSKNLA